MTKLCSSYMLSRHRKAREDTKTSKRLESRCLSATEVTASCSGLLSHHCRWCSVLPALLPACAGARVVTRQATLTFVRMPLQTSCLVGAAHPHAMQDIQQSTALLEPYPLIRAQEGMTLPGWLKLGVVSLFLTTSNGRHITRTICANDFLVSLQPFKNAKNNRINRQLSGWP